MSKLVLIRCRPMRPLCVALALSLLATSPLGVAADSDPMASGAGTPPRAIGLPLILVRQSHTEPPATLSVDLTVANPLGVARVDEPVTSGVPIPQEQALTDVSSLRLLNPSGSAVPAQFTPLARWGGAPDDSRRPISWLLVDFQASVPSSSSPTYRLVNTAGAVPPLPPLSVVVGATAIDIDTGSAQYSISRADGSLNGPGLASPMFGRVQSGGISYETRGPVTVTVEMDGSMRASVHVKGSYRDSGGRALLDYTSRYWFYAGHPTVRMFHTVENNTLCPLGDTEQITCFYIGSPGSVALADLSIVLPTGVGQDLRFLAGGAGTPISGTLTDDLLLYQDSRGTDHWDAFTRWASWTPSILDTRPRMQAYVSFRGYGTSLGGGALDAGDHAEGWLTVSGSKGAWSVGVRDFWRNYPKALRASETGTVEVGLFPDEYGPSGYAFSLRPGEHKTHEILLSPTDSLPPLEPLFARAPSQWYVDSGALGLAALPDRVRWPDHEDYVDYQLDTSPDYDPGHMDWFPNLPAAIETSDFYGIYDYGDWPLDYEGYGLAPLNLKYDANLGMWQQWARGGDARWRQLAEAGDRHIADIDILHNLHSPRHWADGIAFGHSAHDEDGFANPHRNINSGHTDTSFGMLGLLLGFYFTGYEKSYEAAMEMADCIEYRLHNTSQLCDQFGQCSGQGYAFGDADGLYEANARPVASSLDVAVAAYRATADRRYLDVADAVVGWARSSDQPYINGPTGADQMMRPWMLGMYLRALASYTEMRKEFGLPDTHGAETSFLAYADWLHSYPWIALSPIDTGARAAYPYEWWLDGRTGIPGEDNDNGDPSINNWLLLGADAMAYAHRLSGNTKYLDWGERLFRTGTRDPWFEGDENTYAQCKETVNSVTYGHTWLHESAERGETSLESPVFETRYLPARAP